MFHFMLGISAEFGSEVSTRRRNTGLCLRSRFRVLFLLSVGSGIQDLGFRVLFLWQGADISDSTWSSKQYGKTLVESTSERPCLDR